MPQRHVEVSVNEHCRVQLCCLLGSYFSLPGTSDVTSFMSGLASGIGATLVLLAVIASTVWAIR